MGLTWKERAWYWRVEIIIFNFLGCENDKTKKIFMSMASNMLGSLTHTQTPIDAKNTFGCGEWIEKKKWKNGHLQCMWWWPYNWALPRDVGRRNCPMFVQMFLGAGPDELAAFKPKKYVFWCAIISFDNVADQKSIMMSSHRQLFDNAYCIIFIWI